MKTLFEIVRIVIVLAFCFAVVVLLVGGCGSIPLTKDECNGATFPTAHEHELCLKAAKDYEQEQYEKEDRRIKRRDKLIVFLNGCDALPNAMIFETIKMGRSKLPNGRERQKALKKYGYKYTHGNVDRRALRSDFDCVGRSYY